MSVHCVFVDIFSTVLYLCRWRCADGSGAVGLLALVVCWRFVVVVGACRWCCLWSSMALKWVLFALFVAMAAVFDLCRICTCFCVEDVKSLSLQKTSLFHYPKK